jgi:hypothetical protein
LKLKNKMKKQKIKQLQIENNVKIYSYFNLLENYNFYSSKDIDNNLI